MLQTQRLGLLVYACAMRRCQIRREYERVCCLGSTLKFFKSRVCISGGSQCENIGDRGEEPHLAATADTACESQQNAAHSSQLIRVRRRFRFLARRLLGEPRLQRRFHEKHRQASSVAHFGVAA